MLIRRARPDEAGLLAELAVRSKAYWPYPPEFIARFAETLGLTPDVIATNEAWVAERGGAVLAFYLLVHRDERTFLDDLWLEPAVIGQGIGRALFSHARERAAAAGARFLEWDAEPYAVGFYRRMGGRHIGFVDSPLGRELPTMRLALG
ncbi:GNAT family N-acetyltransferase [Pseudonocardia hispaniensis]|uniref:GNAT family N-acetyltransferase n=1 Tax=Pseudonocardia hispaniensis TaxID=904933 RepID=A0ABW1J5C4_9PSEU